VIAILDTCAMLAYLRGESGGAVVRGMLQDSSCVCYAHSVNLCEVYYQMMRRSDESTVREGIEDLFADGVIERPDMGRTFWERVGSHKARGRIALADCFCLALAQELSGQVVTSDHGEFDPIVATGICPIVFIR
jgi:PIN domain nuclease of toxin-antitoxin system